MMMDGELDLYGINQHREEILESDRATHGDDAIGREELSTEEQWEIWKELPGSRQVLRQAYRFASYYAKGWEKYQQRVSAKLIWELTRHHIKSVKARAKRTGVDIRHWKGYCLNNIFTPYLSRHIIDHCPQWDGMFETRRIK